MRNRGACSVSGGVGDDALDVDLARAGPLRLWALAQAFEEGKTIAEVNALTDIDRWFLAKLYSIHSGRKKLEGRRGARPTPPTPPPSLRGLSTSCVCFWVE